MRYLYAMTSVLRTGGAGLMLVVALALTAHAQDKLGKVDFPISCTAPAQQAFNRAVALLHAFEYGAAQSVFTTVADSDPTCAMAYWGLAMTQWPQLWTSPTKTQFEVGAAALARAKVLGARSERERDWVAAIDHIFVDASRSYGVRTRVYEQAMARMARLYPSDREVVLFHALALQVIAPPTDRAHTLQLRSARIIEKIFAEQPDHPGAAHYLLHAYDTPALAARALPAARRYEQLAQSLPHALHMPSHIYSLLGLWEDSVRANRASEAAARAMGEVPEEFHAIDYLVYAHLQQAQDVEARRAIDRMRRPQSLDARSMPVFYAFAAGPARYAVERRRWADAAALPVVASPLPFADALTVFARALGAARSANPAGARQEIQRLDTLREAAEATPYWRRQIDVQRGAAAAWVALAEGNPKEAERLMRDAAALEDANERHSVTPGVIVPARELLGDLFRETKQPALALAAYEASLRREPNRFNGVYGAARAAELAGNREKARTYYEKLLALAANADTERPEMREAKAYLAR